MLRAFTASEMRELDRRTSEERGIPGLILMENAAARVASAVARRCRPLDRQDILVLCGRGNNGGDGLAVARRLSLFERRPALTVALFGEPDQLRGDAATNYRMLLGVGAEPLVVLDAADWDALKVRAAGATLIIDALLGTGLSGPARGLLADVIADVERGFRRARVLAVDLPSGAGSDSGEPLGPTMRADWTVTFTAPKISQVLAPSVHAMGELSVARIGTAEDLIAEAPGAPIWLLERSDARPYLGPRERGAHKGSFGHVGVIGGSRSKPGAVSLAGRAALGMGAGLTTVVTAAGATAAVVGRAPELMTIPADEAADGSLVEESFDPAWLDRTTVVAVGPGIGVAEENQALVRRVVAEADGPVVVDADGITALAGASEREWNEFARPLVLTPHPGEMARLTGLTTAEVQADRLGVARDFAERRGVVLVLKGERTLIARPDRAVYVNPTGTPAMATAGSGDVLTGMIAGLLAQFPDEPTALTAAVAAFLHGLAGESAAAAGDEKCVLAGDLIEALPEAIRRCR